MRMPRVLAAVGALLLAVAPWGRSRGTRRFVGITACRQNTSSRAGPAQAMAGSRPSLTGDWPGPRSRDGRHLVEQHRDHASAAGGAKTNRP